MRFQLDEATEKHRAECEARFWLKQTGGDPDAVRDVLARVEKHRGKKAADKLKEDMRRIYREAKDQAAAGGPATSRTESRARAFANSERP